MNEILRKAFDDLSRLERMKGHDSTEAITAREALRKAADEDDGSPERELHRRLTSISTPSAARHIMNVADEYGVDIDDLRTAYQKTYGAAPAKLRKATDDGEDDVTDKHPYGKDVKYASPPGFLAEEAKYPLNPPRLQAAWAYFQKNKSKYPADKAKVVEGRIKAAYKDHFGHHPGESGEKDGDDDND